MQKGGENFKKSDYLTSKLLSPRIFVIPKCYKQDNRIYTKKPDEANYHLTQLIQIYFDFKFHRVSL